ncbi:MAG: hypothetical protein UHD09_08770 [Bifidobacterium sp.]|nr:hypothetical protein [Bifidobacterium sp.]
MKINRPDPAKFAAAAQAKLRAVERWVDYAQAYLLLDPRDTDWMRNRLLAYVEAHPGALERADAAIVDDDDVMGILAAAPSRVQDRFAEVRAQDDGMAAMHWLYDFCVRDGYVKRDQLARNIRFDADGLVVTINLAKPEFRDSHAASRANSVDGSFAHCVI